MRTLEDLEKLHRENPYPEDMVMFNEFIETHHTQLILLREQARVNDYERLYEAVQNLFEEYFQYSHDRRLYDYPSLQVNGEYDDYLLHTLVEAATPLMNHYGELFYQSRIPLDNTGVHFSGGNYRWGDASSSCSRLIGDIKRIWGENHYE